MKGSSLASAGRKAMDGSGALGGAGAKSSTASVLEVNPFILPADEDVFKMRERERKEREVVKREHTGKRIWEKTEYASTLSRTRRLIEDMAPDVDPIALRKARESKGLVTAATAAIARERHRNTETMPEFIAKKREMFLVQMSLDIKREEIAKLEAKAAAKEEALKKSELLLEEDAVRFDAFLKENDQQAHDAMRRAEAQAKLKSEKLNELKKLRHAIGLVSAERSKLKETLEDYLRYKAFLDALTPPEWVTECQRARREEQERARATSHAAKVSAWESARALKESEVIADAEAQRKAALRAGRPPPKIDIAAAVAAALPPPPRLEDEPLPARPRKAKADKRSGGGAGTAAAAAAAAAGSGSSSPRAGVPASSSAAAAAAADEEDDDDDDDDDDDGSGGGRVPMYFTRPEQLLEIFTQLEESNLFLIQNCQDTEEQLEELRQQQGEMAAAMELQTAMLQENMRALQTQLAAEEAKAAALRSKVGEGAAGAGAAAGSAGGGEAGSGAAAASSSGSEAGVGAAGDRKPGTAGGPAGKGAAGSAASSSGGGAAAGAGAASAAAGGGSAGGGLLVAASEGAVMEAILPELRRQILSVYERCGFKATASSDTISMLAALEGKLESLIAQLAGLDPEYVAAKEKEKEKERRVRVREARLKQQKELHESRLQRMLERAQAPVKKREGKPVMFRSAPPPKKVVVEKADPAIEQEKDEVRFWL